MNNTTDVYGCVEPSDCGNTTDISACPLADRVSGTTMAMVTLCGLICLNGLLGNMLVIFVVTRYTKMKTVTNMYILNLSLADSFFLLGLPLVMTTMVLQRWVFGFVTCKVYYTLTGINMFTGSLTLAAMSVDRYLAVCHPIAAMRYRVPRYTRGTLLATWLTAALFMVPEVLYAQTVDRHVNGSDITLTSCMIKWPAAQAELGERGRLTYTFLLGFIIPVIIIIVTYSLLVSRLRSGLAIKRQSAEHKHRKVTRLVSLIIVVYIACWLPYWVFQIYLVTARPAEVPTWQINMFLIFTLLMYTNSMVNPLLYAFTNEAFRKSFICAFCCAADPFWRRRSSTGATNFNTRAKNVQMGEQTAMTVTGRDGSAKGRGIEETAMFIDKPEEA